MVEIWEDMINDAKKKDDYPSLFSDSEFRPSQKSEIHTLNEFSKYIHIDITKLGNITSDFVYLLMIPKKEEDLGNLFTKNAIYYLNGIIAQKNINEQIVKSEQSLVNYFAEQKIKRFDMCEITSVKQCVEKYQNDNDGCECDMVGVVECGGALEGFCDLPTAIVKKEGKIIGCVSVKKMSGADFVSFFDNFQKGKDLFKLDKRLYWECVAHCLSLSVEWCDLIYYDANQKNGLQVQRIKPPIYTLDTDCDDSIISLQENIKKAIKYINSSSLLKL